MKATLEFDLPEESDEFQTYLQASRLEVAVSDFDNYLRAKIKYEELDEHSYKIYSAVREKLHEILQDREVKIG